MKRILFPIILVLAACGKEPTDPVIMPCQKNSCVEGEWLEWIKQQDRILITSTQIEYWKNGEQMQAIDIQGNIVGGNITMPYGFYCDTCELNGYFEHDQWDKLYFYSHMPDGRPISLLFLLQP